MQKNFRRWTLALALFVLLITFSFAVVYDAFSGTNNTLFPVAVVYGATEGTSNGTASVQSTAPTVSNSDIWNQTETASVNNTDLDVNIEYRINCSISDNNQLYDIENVTYILWDSDSHTEGSPNDEKNHYTFIYYNDTDSWGELDTSGHLISANCSDPADHSQTSGEYKLAFKLNKTAQGLVTSAWVVKIYVYDGSGNTDNEQAIAFGVNFYAEITINESPTTHGWTGLSPGDTDVQITSPGDGDIDITITTNDNYDVQAKGSGALTNGSNTIGLGNVTIHETTLGSSVSLTTSYADIGGLTNENFGFENNNSFKLWIDVPVGTPDGDYTYTLSVQVVQH